MVECLEALEQVSAVKVGHGLHSSTAALLKGERVALLRRLRHFLQVQTMRSLRWAAGRPGFYSFNALAGVHA